MANRPQPEIDITDELVRGLIRSQFPELANEPIRPLSRGWDNTNLRLGDSRMVRVPHRQVAVQLIEHEQRWLPELSEHVTLPIPVPTHAGRPDASFPWPWSINAFFDGVEAASAQLSDPSATAQTLGDFFAQLHVPAPADAPLNPYRGCPLQDRADSFFTNLAALDRNAWDHEQIARLFTQACAAPRSSERVWLHGDLHARNMIVHDGQLAGVIDWGDVCAGDRATDLAGALMLVPDQLDIVHLHAGTNSTDWVRARGWAAHFGVVYLAHSDDDAVMAGIGHRLLTSLLAE